jgi:ParB family transcriptional regulator, chromosome partitioning protein
MAEPSQRTTETRQRLGRGLAALLGDAKPGSEYQGQLQGVKQVPVEFVRSNSRNPRNSFSEADLDDLAASIRERGIIQPIVVRPVVGASDAYEIVAGERRWRAAQRAGLHTVPVISMQLNDREALELSIVENVQRADLNALEEARGYAQLASDYGYSHSDIGRIIGKSRSHIANTLRLLGLPEHTRKLLTEGALTAGHARALLSVKNPDGVADKVVARGLTVRDVEKLGGNGELVVASSAAASENDAVTRDLENRLTLSLGASVKIKISKRVRELRVKFKDLDQVEYICERLLRVDSVES